MEWTVMAWAALVGLGATLVMDAWSLLLRRLGVPTLDYAMLGRWVGHLWRGRFAHPGIAQAAAIPGERRLGWLAHYATGIAFALLIVAVLGAKWLHAPTAAPALAAGIATVVAPLFIMQPAMGAGFAASKTATPLGNCLRSLVTHAVFGAGIYLAATLVATLGG
ncbi:DUF2938 family protein [Xanthomonas sacchari]|uniref:DUF2938 family protein n=1 Tax=Xanthomonas sacchari TaxID=56458 RepID=UPI0020C53A2F|nr:DUF2938 family protein [Xanthomonas sacchari]